MDLEFAFAHAVRNASTSARAHRKLGIARTTSEEIECECGELYELMSAQCASREAIEDVIKRHVVQRADGTFSPRRKRKPLEYPAVHALKMSIEDAVRLTRAGEGEAGRYRQSDQAKSQNAKRWTSREVVREVGKNARN